MSSTLDTLLLRETIDANYQTKGSTLSYAELDENLILLADIIRENIVNITPGGVEPYAPLEEYEDGEYVTYGGNLWLYVNPTPSIGNTPGVGSSYWSLQSTGALSHQQNTDLGTNSNSFYVGDGNDTDKTLFAANGDVNPPRLRYNAAGNKWQYTNNGVAFIDFVDSTAIDAALALKLNIADYNILFLGKYTSVGALMTAHPSATAGQYAQVDPGPGSEVVNYNWDDEEGWVEGGSGSGAPNTDALAEGTTNLYFTTARVLSTVLAGLNTALTGAPTSTDAILAAFGRISNFITNIYNTAHTWTLAQTFTVAPTLSSTTASQTLEVDASKNVISVAKNSAYNVDFATSAEAEAGTVTNKPITPALLKEQTTKYVDLGNLSGSVSIDLSTGRKFKINQVGNITAFTFTNAVIGNEYSFRIERSTTAYTFTLTPTKWEVTAGSFSGLTNPTTNGSSPAHSTDIIVGQCWVANVLSIVNSGDMQPF